MFCRSAAASCSTHAGMQHWNFGHRNCCESVERSMSWQRLDTADGHQCPTSWMSSTIGMQVYDPLATDASDMQPCSQLVDEQEASAIEAAPAWCGHIDKSRWPDVRRRSGHTVQQRVAVVETAVNESLDRCSGGGHWLNSWTYLSKVEKSSSTERSNMWWWWQLAVQNNSQITSRFRDFNLHRQYWDVSYVRIIQLLMRTQPHYFRLGWIKSQSAGTQL